MSGVLKKACWLLPVLFVVSPVLAQQGGGIQSAANIESHISFMSVFRGLLGIVSLLAIAWLFSKDRKAISWKVVGIGLAMQLVLAVGILYVPAVQAIFEFFGKIFIRILDFTRDGSIFLLGDLMDTTKAGYIFAFQVLPTIIFFSALTSLLFYLGIIQKVVYAMAWVMTKLMNISGMESLSVAGNIFLGQTEAPLMIKEYLDDMSPSEIFLVMTGGMATIAGGVLAAYISFLGGEDPVQRLIFAKHLLAASVMAAPGAVVFAKMLVPQTRQVNNNIQISKNKVGKNILDAISNGAAEGVKLAVNVAGMLLVFVGAAGPEGRGQHLLRRAGAGDPGGDPGEPAEGAPGGPGQNHQQAGLRGGGGGGRGGFIPRLLHRQRHELGPDGPGVRLAGGGVRPCASRPDPGHHSGGGGGAGGAAHDDHGGAVLQHAADA